MGSVTEHPRTEECHQQRIKQTVESKCEVPTGESVCTTLGSSERRVGVGFGQVPKVNIFFQAYL